MGAPVASNMLPEKENCTQDFLNAGQYKRNGILRYEKVFGHTFVSTGGLTTTKQIVDPIGLKPGMKVLDIGCGTGGSAFYMARNFGCEVLGLDLSDNMLAVAYEHKLSMEEKVQNLVSFRFLDATLAEFPENYFDCVYTRDAVMHIAEKELMYSKVFKWLKPGGKLVISEYVHGRNHPNHTTEYVEYIKDRGYQLVTVQEYGNVLKKVGFKNVQAIDKTAEFISILKMEMEKFKPTKDKFIKEFSLKDYKDLTEGWDIKVERCSKGEQGWGWFTALKE